MIVRLDWGEIYRAADVGLQRQIANLRRGRQDVAGAEDGLGWEYHMIGAIGECAVAKALGIYWNGNMGNLGAADVADLEVRTADRSYKKLILRPDDPHDSIFILALVHALPSVKLAGWIKGEDGMLAMWEQAPNGRPPAYFVPQSSLYSMRDLSSTIEAIAS